MSKNNSKSEGSKRKIYAPRLAKAEKVYYAVSFAGEVSVDQLEKMLDMPRRTIYDYLSWLVARGYLGKRREGIRVKYYVKKPFSAETLLEEFEREDYGAPRGEAPVYREAWKIMNLVDKYDLRADLIGACKVHLFVPGHERITTDIDAVVVREDVNKFTEILEKKLGYRAIAHFQGPIGRMDYKFYNPVTGIGLDLYVDGVKKGGVLLWNFREPLLEQGRLLLEHAVACKLGRDYFVGKTDGYDIAVSLPHIDIDILTDIMKEAVERAPELLENFYRNMEITKRTIKEDSPLSYEYVATLLRKVREAFEKKVPVPASIREAWATI